MTQRPPGRSLFWRIYRHGLVLLLLVVLATAIGGWLQGQHFPHHRHAQQVALRVAADLGPGTPQPARLQQRVQDLHVVLRADVAAYDSSGARIAAAGAAPPAALSEQEQRLGRKGRTVRRGLRLLAAVQLRGGGQLVVGWSAVGGLTRLATTLLVTLLVVALAAIPLTRAITGPLDRLAQTARKLGQGDLSARTGLQRRDEVGRLARVMDEMAARLERIVKGEKELWANISHELRTPVSRIRVALELCVEEMDVGQVHRHLTGIETDLAELEQLMDDVLTAARLDLAGGGVGLAPRPQPLDPVLWAQEAAGRFRERHAHHKLELDLPVTAGLVQGDSVLLHRALGNLLDNAAKHSEHDGPIELALGQEGGVTWVEVRDRGVGVDPADLPRLFDRFFRSDRSRARDTGGSGLGLAICKRVVEAHGGEISAVLRPGGGLVVHFTLPG